MKLALVIGTFTLGVIALSQNKPIIVNPDTKKVLVAALQKEAKEFKAAEQIAHRGAREGKYQDGEFALETFLNTHPGSINSAFAKKALSEVYLLDNRPGRVLSLLSQVSPAINQSLNPTSKFDPGFDTDLFVLKVYAEGLLEQANQYHLNVLEDVFMERLSPQDREIDSGGIKCLLPTDRGSKGMQQLALVFLATTSTDPFICDRFAERLEQLDPSNPFAVTRRYGYYLQGHFDEGIAAVQKALPRALRGYKRELEWNLDRYIGDKAYYEAHPEKWKWGKKGG